MLTEKIWFLYQNTGHPSKATISVPEDLSFMELSGIVLSGGDLVWDVCGIQARVPRSVLTNILDLYEETNEFEAIFNRPDGYRQYEISYDSTSYLGRII